MQSLKPCLGTGLIYVEDYYIMSKVTVHRLKKFYINSGQEVVSKFYATRQAIEQFGGTFIEGSAIDIEESMLDGNGRYRPKAE